MVRRDVVRVLLLLDECAQEIFGSTQLFEWNHCQCHFARSEREASEILKAGKFDIVLRGRPSVGQIRADARAAERCDNRDDYLLDWRFEQDDRSERRWERPDSFRQKQ